MVLVGKGTWKVRNWEGEWGIKINVWKRLTFPNKNLFQGTFQWHFRENFQLLAFSLFEIVPGSQIRSVSITERYMIAYSSSDTLSTEKKLIFETA